MIDFAGPGTRGESGGRTNGKSLYSVVGFSAVYPHMKDYVQGVSYAIYVTSILMRGFVNSIFGIILVGNWSQGPLRKPALISFNDFNYR